jgi:hypothetical protein
MKVMRRACRWLAMLSFVGLAAFCFGCSNESQTSTTKTLNETPKTVRPPGDGVSGENSTKTTNDPPIKDDLESGSGISRKLRGPKIGVGR